MNVYVTMGEKILQYAKCIYVFDILKVKMDWAGLN